MIKAPSGTCLRLPRVTRSPSVCDLGAIGRRWACSRREPRLAATAYGFGGSAEDFAAAVRVNQTGTSRVAGRTFSADASFPDLPQTFASEGDSDGFIAALTPASSQPPTANAGPDNEDQWITFDGSNSSDPDGDALTYLWSFGDGQNVQTTDPLVDHVFAWTDDRSAGTMASSGLIPHAQGPSAATIDRAMWRYPKDEEEPTCHDVSD